MNWSRVDEIRLDLSDHASKIKRQTRQVAPAEFASPARPQNLLNVSGNRAIFRLALVGFQSKKEDFMFRLRQGGEKTIIVWDVIS